MSVAEGYAKAVRSSQLKMDEHPGDADKLVAAGWSNLLGPVLLRCKQEWDAQRADHERNVEVRISALAAREATGREMGPALSAAMTRGPIERATSDFARSVDATTYRDRVESDAATSRVLILMNMTSLRPAKAYMKRLALDRVKRRNLDIERSEIVRCVGDALDLWIDQRCNQCAGRGFNGGYGAPVITCRVCRSTGKRRRVFPSKTSAEHTLGEWLIAQADIAVEEAQRKMSRALR